MAKPERVKQPKMNKVHHNEMEELLNGVKLKYEHYIEKDKVNFPPIPFNSTQRYAALQESFKAELSKYGPLEQVLANYPLPSSSYFAQIFHLKKIPGPQTIDTLYMYVHGKPRAIFMKG